MRGQILVALVLVFVALALDDVPLEPMRDVRKTKGAAGRGIAMKPVGSSKFKYPFAEIDRRLRDNRRDIAACFWIDSKALVGRYSLRLAFEPNSKLRSLEVQPGIAKSIEHCLQSLVSTWLLPPSASSRPFTFEAVLSI